MQRPITHYPNLEIFQMFVILDLGILQLKKKQNMKNCQMAMFRI